MLTLKGIQLVLGIHRGYLASAMPSRGSQALSTDRVLIFVALAVLANTFTTDQDLAALATNSKRSGTSKT
jgi:hypothetical protein